MKPGNTTEYQEEWTEQAKEIFQSEGFVVVSSALSEEARTAVRDAGTEREAIAPGGLALQGATEPEALAGADLVGVAQTNNGKTPACFDGKTPTRQEAQKSRSAHHGREGETGLEQCRPSSMGCGDHGMWSFCQIFLERKTMPDEDA